MATRFAALAKKPHKYHAQKTVVNGIPFPSKAEAQRYSELLLLEKAGEIRALGLQPKIPLTVNNRIVCFYIADFIYTDKNGERILEETKGFETPVWKLKHALFRACYPERKLFVLYVEKKRRNNETRFLAVQ